MDAAGTLEQNRLLLLCFPRFERQVFGSSFLFIGPPASQSLPTVWNSAKRTDTPEPDPKTTWEQKVAL